MCLIALILYYALISVKVTDILMYNHMNHRCVYLLKYYIAYFALKTRASKTVSGWQCRPSAISNLTLTLGMKTTI